MVGQHLILQRDRQISTMSTYKEIYSSSWPIQYEIHIQENLGAHWADWFNGMTLTYHAAGYSRLVGEVPDKAALHGILNTIRDMGFTLLSVNPIGNETKKGDKDNNQ